MKKTEFEIEIYHKFCSGTTLNIFPINMSSSVSQYFLRISRRFFLKLNFSKHSITKCSTLLSTTFENYLNHFCFLDSDLQKLLSFLRKAQFFNTLPRNRFRLLNCRHFATNFASISRLIKFSIYRFLVFRYLRFAIFQFFDFLG